MKALLRPLFVGTLSIAIALTTLLGTSSTAMAASPLITTWSLRGPVFEGDRPFLDGTFTDGTDQDSYTVEVDWGDGTAADTYALGVGARSFSLQKSVPYANEMSTVIQITLADASNANIRFLSVTVENAAPSVTSFALSSADVETGQNVTATGAFTDTGTADTHTVTLNWGDGSPTTTLNLAAGVYTFTSPAHTYSAADTYTVTATITDNAGASAVATSTVSVHAANHAPTIASLVLTAGSEGGSSSLALSFADADALDTHTVSVAWGDASTSDSGSLGAGVTTFETSHVYADTGAYSVVVTLRDSAGHSVTASGSVSPTNVAPVVGALTLSPASVVDHQTVTVSGSFTDPGTADTFTLTIDWGDTKSSSQSLPAGTRSFSDGHAYDAAGPVTITATVADRDNGKSSASTNLVVLPSNHAPANLAVQATPVLEGGTTTLSVSFTDAEAADTHTVAIVWGDGASESVSLASGVTSTSATHTYAETGTYTVAVTVTDAGGMSVGGGTTVNAINVSPSLSSLVLTPASVTDHETLTVSGTFSDPGTADSFTLALNWGDGSSSTQTLAAGTRSYSASHAYAAAGTYDVMVTVTDRDGGSGSQTATVFVAARNTAPTALTFTPFATGANLELTGSFTDPDALDTHNVSVTWGDSESTSQTLPAGTTTFDAGHIYAASGTYTVTVTVTDSAGASTSASRQAVITVPVVTAAAVLDEMTDLVLSFGLDRNTERWMLRKIDDLKESLINGNGQICSGSGSLSHLMWFAERNLTSNQYAQLSVLATKLQVAAGCVTANVRGNQSAKNAVAGRTTPPARPTPKSSGGHEPR
jgi:PKD repeat protein